MIPAGFIYPWWCRISAMNSFSVWMMKWWFNKCHLAKPLWHTKDSAMISTTYSNKLSQPEMVKSIFIIFSMIQKFIWFICFSSQLQRNEASTPHKTIAHTRKLKAWSWKGPSKLAGREKSAFFGSHNKFPPSPVKAKQQKTPWFLWNKVRWGRIAAFFHPKSWESSSQKLGFCPRNHSFKKAKRNVRRLYYIHNAS